MQALCEKNLTDAVTIRYDPMTPFHICARTLLPLYRGRRLVQCPYCGAHYHPEDEHDAHEDATPPVAGKQEICRVCGLAHVNATSSGLELMQSA